MRFAILMTAFRVVAVAGCKSSALSQQQPTKPAILSGNDTEDQKGRRTFTVNEWVT